MTANEAMRKAVKATGIPQKGVAAQIGLKSASSLTNYMKSDVRMSTFLNIMSNLGYTVTVSKDNENWEITE